MTKIEQLVAAVKLEHPERSEDEILADLLERGLIHKGYVVDESMELESNVGRPHPARLVKEWVVLKDGRPEFRANTEEEGSNTWIGGCGRMRKKRIDSTVPCARLDRQFSGASQILFARTRITTINNTKPSPPLG